MALLGINAVDVQAGAGSLSNVSYGFIGEANTGLYRVGAANPGIVAGGVLSCSFITTGVNIPGVLQVLGAGMLVLPTMKIYPDGGGDSYWHEVSGNVHQFVAGTVPMLDISPTDVAIYGNLLMPADNTHDIGLFDNYRPRDLFVARNAAIGGSLKMPEIADPAAPAANNGLVYMRDNGSGKTQFVARFPSGAVQVIATEP